MFFFPRRSGAQPDFYWALWGVSSIDQTRKKVQRGNLVSCSIHRPCRPSMIPPMVCIRRRRWTIFFTECSKLRNKMGLFGGMQPGRKTRLFRGVCMFFVCGFCTPFAMLLRVLCAVSVQFLLSFCAVFVRVFLRGHCGFFCAAIVHFWAVFGPLWNQKKTWFSCSFGTVLEPQKCWLHFLS